MSEPVIFGQFPNPPKAVMLFRLERISRFGWSCMV